MIRPPLVDDVTLSAEGTMVQFRLPSLAADTLDSYGNMPIWKLTKLFECGRVTAVFDPDFFMNKLVQTGDLTAFIILLNMDIGRHLYTKTRAKGWVMPLDLITTLSGFGRTSTDYVTFLKDPDDGETLASLKFKYATVSLTSRKAVEIPQQIKNMYSRYLKPDHVVQPYIPSRRPGSAHSLTLVLKPSHIDRNQHMNNSVYLRVCTDCASAAAHAGRLRQFSGNMTYHHAKSMKALYRKECRLGDILTAYCWEDDVKPLVMHYDVEKADGQLSFQCTIEYYPQVDAKL